MPYRIISGIATSIMILLAVLFVKALRFGPPPLLEIPPADIIAIDEDLAAERLAKSIRFRTVSHNPDMPVEEKAFRDFHDFLVRRFPKIHASLKREPVSDFSLLYTWQGSDPSLKPVLLNAHMDVVPVEPGTEADWTHPPFSGAIADGFIWGRGTMDMKASLTGILEAVEHLITQGFVPARTVYLTFSHDEEVGGSNGTAKIAELLEERGVRLDYTLDEGLVITHGIVPGVDKPAALVGLAEKGAVVLERTGTQLSIHLKCLEISLWNPQPKLVTWGNPVSCHLCSSAAAAGCIESPARKEGRTASFSHSYMARYLGPVLNPAMAGCSTTLKRPARTYPGTCNRFGTWDSVYHRSHSASCSGSTSVATMLKGQAESEPK